MNIIELASRAGIAGAFAADAFDAINHASKHAALAQPLNQKLSRLGLKPLSEEQLRIGSQIGGVVLLGLTAGFVLSRKPAPFALAMAGFTLAATVVRSVQHEGIDFEGVSWGLQRQLMIAAAQSKLSRIDAKAQARLSRRQRALGRGARGKHA